MAGAKGRADAIADLPILSIEMDRLKIAPADADQSPGFSTILVRLHLADGTMGLGECRDEAGLFVTLQERASAFLGRDVFGLQALRDAWTRRRWPGSDRRADAGWAAIETAALDAQARHLGWPLHRLLGAPPPAPRPLAVRLDLAQGPEAAIAAADRLLGLHRALALTVECSGDPTSLAILLGHVRERHGAELPIRLDLGARLPDALARELALAAAPFWPEALIDPCATLPGAARLRLTVASPVALRRAAPGAVELATALRLEALDLWQADPVASGGPEAFRKGTAVARAFNLDIGLAAEGLTEIGAALALHLAATSPLVTGGVELHPSLLEGDGLLATGLRIDQGKAAIPAAAGLGVDLAPEKLAAARVASARVALTQEPSP